MAHGSCCISPLEPTTRVSNRSTLEKSKCGEKGVARIARGHLRPPARRQLPSADKPLISIFPRPLLPLLTSYRKEVDRATSKIS